MDLRGPSPSPACMSEVFDTIFNMNSRSDIDELVKQITIEAAQEDNDHFRNMVENRTKSGINIREGLVDNMAAILDPALQDWQIVEQRNMYQVNL